MKNCPAKLKKLIKQNDLNEKKVLENFFSPISKKDGRKTLEEEEHQGPKHKGGTKAKKRQKQLQAVINDILSTNSDEAEEHSKREKRETLPTERGKRDARKKDGQTLAKIKDKKNK